MPEAEPLVASFRARYAAASVAEAIPAHITLLFPFVEAGRVDDALRALVEAHFAAALPFAAELSSVGRFEAYVWLVPEPRERFVELVTATWSRFPECPPYGGDFAEIVPHLTVGGATEEVTTDEIVAAAGEELAPRLPLPFVADAAWLLVEQVDRTWVADERFPFGP